MHAKRAPPARQRGFLQLTRCKLNHRPVNRGDARDGDGRPARAPTSARTPRSLAACWQGARKREKEVLKAYVNMMFIDFARACRLQDAASMSWTRRLQKVAARL